jgi:hypothetical protein
MLWPRPCENRSTSPRFLTFFHMETPSPYTSFGAKGICEGGAVGPPAVIVSVVWPGFSLRGQAAVAGQTCR